MADQSLNVIVKLVDQASGGLKSLQEKFDGMNDSLQKTTGGAQTFTKAVTAVGVAVGTYAVHEFMDYEKTMSKVQAVTESTAEEMKKMNELAQEEGSRTKFSTKEVADAMYVLGQAGLDASAQMKVLPGVLDLATAADQDLATSADIMISTLNGMQLPMEKTWRVMDVMAKTTNLSAINMVDYGESMKYIAPTAAALKIPLEEVSAYIAIMGNNGEKGSIATRAFGTALSNLANPPKRVSDALSALNVELFDAQGQFIGLPSMIDRLNKAMAGMTDQEKLAYTARIFGNEALQEATILLHTGADGFDEFTKKIKESDGAGRKMADTMMNNLAGSWEQFTGTLENMAIAVGKAIGEYLRPALDYMTNALRDMAGWWQTLSPLTQEIITGIGAVVVVLGGLVFAVGAVALVVWPILTMFSTLAGSFAAIAGVGGAAVSGIAGIAAALWPVGLIIVGVVAAMALLYAAWNGNWFGMRDTVMNVVNAWNGFFEKLGSDVFDIVTSITTFFSNAWDTIKNTAESVWNAIAGVFQTLGNIWLAINLVIIDSILQLFGTNLAEVLVTITQIWESVKNATSVAWTAITGVLTAVWEGIKLFFTTTLATIKSVFSTAWDTMKGVAKIAGDAIGGVVGSLWDGITSMFDKGAAMAGGAWKKFTDSLGSVMTATWQGIKDTIASSINWIIDKANAVIRSVNSVASKTGFTISEIPRVAFQTGGIVPGGVNPANHDQLTAAVDPGELILNRSQQSNIANQLTNGGGSSQGGGTTIVIKLENNTFHWADPAYAQKIADMIFSEFNKHASLPWY